MARYSVAEAKNNLPRLIDKAIAGEEVVITRHGKTVVELRSRPEPAAKAPYDYEAMRRRRQAEPSIGMTSVELLALVYEDYPY